MGLALCIATFLNRSPIKKFWCPEALLLHNQKEVTMPCGNMSDLYLLILLSDQKRWHRPSMLLPYVRTGHDSMGLSVVRLGLDETYQFVLCGVRSEKTFCPIPPQDRSGSSKLLYDLLSTCLCLTLPMMNRNTMATCAQQ